MTDVITRLENLLHLDISLVNEELHIHERTASDLLDKYDRLPNLLSLDVSGWRDRVKKEALLNYIDHHPKLK